MVTGKNAGSVNVDDRTDDWLKLYVNDLGKNNKIRNWKKYGLHKGGGTSLPANGVYDVKFKWTNTDGAGAFKVKVRTAIAYKQYVDPAHAGQVYKNCKRL